MADTPWSLVAVADGEGVVTRALLADGSLRRIDVVPDGLAPIDIVRRWDRFAPILADWRIDTAAAAPYAPLRAPLAYPGKVVCVGANYRDHRQEMETALDGAVAREPFYFLKPPATTVIGPEDPILVRGDGDRVDWEAEVGIVIGRAGRFIEESDALDHVAGYTLVNDVSARGLLKRDNPMNPAFGYDWLSCKGQDSFCPTGPGIVPAWLVPDPDAIPFSLAVNGVTEQDGSTANLITGMRRIIAALSELMTLEPGDLIATGTPGGVGVAKGRFLSPGDEVTLSSPLLGTFRNPVRAAQP